MLKLREATIEDFDFYFRLKCEESSIYWSGFPQKPNSSSLFSFWENVIYNRVCDKKIFVLEGNKEAVGYVQTVKEDSQIGVSMGVLEKYRGKGYGNELIKLASIDSSYDYYCYIREDNIASQKSFEKNGFWKTDKFYMQYFEIDKAEYKMIKYIKERQNKRLIAIIPARSGSKGLKDKNIRPLNGKPLLAYSVEAALDSGLFDIVHVSTDSQEYADIAKSYGADEPFLRDEKNAGDASSSWDAVREVLKKYEERGKIFDICVLLQPTSPMRTGDEIKSAYRLFENQGAKSLTSVTEVDHPVQWCFKIDETCSMKDFASSPYKDCRRQQLEKHYRENGAIYIVGTSDIIDPEFDFYTDQCVAYIMDRDRSIDIDTMQDFMIAETILKMQSEEQ